MLADLSELQLIALVLIGGILCLFAAYGAGSVLISPAQSAIDPEPNDLPIVRVAFDSASGSTISGWLISSQSNCAAIILMHGIRDNRRSMLGRARFLFAAGYDVLLFDFRSHGESPGEYMTFGYLEKLDAIAAVAFMKAIRPDEPVAVIGVSLGGAAATLSGDQLKADAVILEQVFPTIKSALLNRLRLHIGSLADLVTPVLLLQLNLRLGFGPEELRPIDRIASLHAPVFVLAGSNDKKTPEQESRALFAAATYPKNSWFIEGAAHEDFHRYAGSRYEEKVLSFLRHHLICK